MSFFAPWMLLGLFAAAIPAILHLVRKRSADRVAWGAWMFLADTLVKKRRKLLIEDMVLMAIRTLAIVFASLAFARPFLPEVDFFGGRGTDKDVALVFDVSASMNLAGPDGASPFERAKEEAEKLVKLSPRGTAFAVLAGDRTPVILTPSPISSKREVLDLIGSLEPGSGAMDAPRTLAAAGEVLSGGGNPAKEVVIYGDGQAYGWRAGDSAEWKRVERIFSRFDRRPPVIWRTLEGPDGVRNAAIAGVAPSRRIVGTDRPVSFAVTVVNSGSEAFSPGEAVFSVDGVEDSRVPVGQILPGMSRTFSFSHAFETGGRHDTLFSLTAADDIASDSAVSNSVDAIDRLGVVLVDGSPQATGFARPGAFVEAALRPEIAGTNLEFLVSAKTVGADGLEDSSVFEGCAVAILCDVPSMSPKAVTNLSSFVDAGGGLLAIAGPDATGAYSTNSVFAAATTNWNGKLKDVAVEGAPVAGRAGIPEELLVGGFDVIARFSDSAPAVVAKNFGRGKSAVSAFPFSLEWTAFPARPEFVPFVHELVYSLAATNSVSIDEDVRWRSREGDLKAMTRDEADAVSAFVDLGIARSAGDALSAVVGRSFGAEIWRPFAIAALLLVVAELLFCRRLDAGRGGRVRSAPRFVLRTLSFLAIIWMLLHICWRHDFTREIHRRVAVVTDASRSMSQADDATNGVERRTVATNLAASIESSLSARYDVEPFEFGGETTSFADALETVLDRIPSEELAGAVFLTDGRSTDDTVPEAAARRFARLGAKICSVVIGSESNRADVAIESVRAAENVFLGDKVRVSATVRADMLAGRRVAVKFLEGENEIERREFSIDSDSWTKEVRFVRDPEGKGVLRYSVALEPPEEDSEPENDAWPFEVSVSDDRTNVLMADSRPRWEFRYLRNLLYARDKSVHLQYVLAEPDRISGVVAPDAPEADASRPFGEAEAGRLPSKREDWRKFDIIVLGDLGADTIGPREADDIKYCVEERGAMLVVVAGERHMPREFAAGALADLLPVACTNAAGEVVATWRGIATSFALTPSGAGHPATSLAPSASENDRIWSSLLPARSRLTGLSVKPGAEVLLFAADSTAAAAPLLTVRETGRGKVVFLATDETWHLRYRKGDAYHHRFWGNLFKWGSGEKLREGNLHARAGTDRLRYAPGDTVRISAKFLDSGFLPVAKAKPRAEIVAPDGKARTMELVRRDETGAYYEGTFDSTGEEGEYTATIFSDRARRELGGDWPDRLAVSFRVDRAAAPVEFAHTSADRALPGRLAGLTGGEVCGVDGVSALDGAFGAGKSEVSEHVETPVWNHWSALAVFVASLALAWISRKRKGLA